MGALSGPVLFDMPKHLFSNYNPLILKGNYELSWTGRQSQDLKQGRMILPSLPGQKDLIRNKKHGKSF
jgi:hypothetical protein